MRKCDLYNRKEDYLSGIPVNFRFYVRSFIGDAQDYGWDIHKIFKTSFEMKEMSDDLAGQCNFASRDITVNSKYWYNSDFYERKRIIYHELGHCFLRRKDHNDNCLPNGYPASLMVSKENTNGCDLSGNSLFFCPDFSSYYLSELFDRAKGLPTWGNVDDLYCNYSTEVFQLNLYFKDSGLSSEGGPQGSTGSGPSGVKAINAVLKLLKGGDVLYSGRIDVFK